MAWKCLTRRWGTEHRARKTHVLASVCSQVMKGRGGVGGHVNVPGTSSATCCYAAQMCGSVGCCIHEGVRWGGMLTFLVLLPLHVATLHRCVVVWVAVYMKG